MVYTVEWLAWRERGAKKGRKNGMAAWLRAHLVEPVRAWNRRQRDLQALANLDAHELHDIGLTRGEIPYVISRGTAANDGGANDNAPRRAA
jgi:uncharacterized protein YjiS (DUF1127 family)